MNPNECQFWTQHGENSNMSKNFSKCTLLAVIMHVDKLIIHNDCRYPKHIYIAMSYFDISSSYSGIDTCLLKFHLHDNVTGFQWFVSLEKSSNIYNNTEQKTFQCSLWRYIDQNGLACSYLTSTLAWLTKVNAWFRKHTTIDKHQIHIARRSYLLYYKNSYWKFKQAQYFL